MADLTGKTLGKYRLVERLGRGGMAEVYKGYQPSMDRYVAIKLMHAYLAEDEGFVGRFRREARAIANLRHPHIVQAYDFDIEGDVYYMVQEYVDGGTLKDRLREANRRSEMIPVEETVRILKAICDAVEYAHAQGCIHRDIKPDNIMFDADDRPVLTDFGIASIVGGTRFTATGAMIGTPAYMSPEQGKGEPNDPRSDIYSLGVVLYEMVTGQVPFDADTPFAVVLKHVNEALPMPSKLNPHLKPGVERVILKALAKDPEDRYQTARALSDDLEEAIREPATWGWQPEADVPPEPVPVAATTTVAAESTAAPPQPAVKQKKRWLWVAAIAAIAVAIGCCFVGLVAVRQNQARKATASAVAPVGERMGDGVASLVARGIETLGEECDGDVDAAKALFENALEQDGNAAPAYVGLARCSICAGEVQDALDALDRATAVAPQDAAPFFWRGRLWLDQEAGEEAYADLTQAIALDPEFAEAYYWRGLAASWLLEDNDRALADLDKAIDLAPGLADAFLMRGRLYFWHRNDPDRGLEDLDRFVELKPDVPDGYAERGEIYLEGLMDYGRAIAEYTLAIERDDHQPYLFQRRAWAHGHLQEWDLAVEDYTRALNLDQGQELYLLRGMALYYGERYAEAVTDLDRAIAIGGSYEGAAHHGKGWVYYALGQYEDAIEAYNHASEYEWEEYAWPFFEDSHWLLDRGAAYRELGRFEEALDDYQALMSMWDGWFLPYYERGLTYRAMGREQEALADLRQALDLAEDPDWQRQIVQDIEASPTSE